DGIRDKLVTGVQTCALPIFELFNPRPPEAENARKLMNVATLTPVKDQTTLLRAFCLVHAKAPKAGLDIVGDGPLRSELERLAARSEERRVGKECRARWAVVT